MSKALIVNPYWDTLGGGERYTASVVKLLLSRGWQTDILSPVDYSAKTHDRFGLDLAGARWLNQPYKDLTSTLYDLLFWLSDGSLPVSFSPKTVIHLQFPFSGVGGGSPVNRLKSRFYTFIVNSGFTKAFIDREFGVNSKVIYPPVDTNDFKAGVKQNIILYAGRFSALTQAKGQQILVNVFKSISEKLPGWELVLAGGTTVGLDPAVMQKLKEGITGFPVRIITDPSYPELKKLFGVAKIFWSAGGFGVNENTDPTRVEHFGITVVEAMAAGAVPVITNLGGHKEIVTPGQDGYLWNNTQELMDITIKLATDKKQLELFSRRAQNKSKMFDIDHFNAAFSSLLKL